MTLQQQEKVRDLCRQAVGEQDVSTLLRIFLELDEATQAEQRNTWPERLEIWRDRDKVRTEPFKEEYVTDNDL